MSWNVRLTLTIVCGLSGLVSAQDLEPPKRVEVAPGIYVFMTPPYGDVGLDGNSVVIVSNDGVLVFDTNGTPAAAENVLAQIRKLTDQPVTYVVNSHWHWDHWYGTEVYRRAFPEVHVITHEKTREMMMGPALTFNKPGLDQQLPGYLDDLATRIAAAESTTPPLTGLARMKGALSMGRFFLDQKRKAQHTFADVTFSDRLTVYLGDREIQVLNYGRAVTPGDALLYLPKEKVVVTGDLLVNPVSFALGVYPTGWLQALERIDGLDATVWIPGHGEPLRDKILLHATMDVFSELLRQGKEARAKGLKPAEAIAAIAPSLRDLRARITKDDPRTNGQFDLYLVSWYLHRVYDELSGPLTDAITPPPG
ncbi:MAG: MBL fold metallo-hydrolase [Vicinamibacteria bacterium]|nr:MBL fold metallo-hydrolase [Vicinamibacteria bacterium]